MQLFLRVTRKRSIKRTISRENSSYGEASVNIKKVYEQQQEYSISATNKNKNGISVVLPFLQFIWYIYFFVLFYTAVCLFVCLSIELKYVLVGFCYILARRESRCLSSYISLKTKTWNYFYYDIDTYIIVCSYKKNVSLAFITRFVADDATTNYHLYSIITSGFPLFFSLLFKFETPILRCFVKA